MEKYLDSTLSPEERAADLTERLTLKEKINQLACKMMPISIPGMEEMIPFEDGIGQIAVMSGKNTPVEHAEAVRKIQERVMDSSKYKIPAIIHCEALSGPAFPGGVTYPTSISLGASFDPELVKEMGDFIREQMCAVGVRQALSPVLDVSRDLRWGRINETYGNDPTLVAEMSCAFVEGIQGEDHKEGVAATAKHFLGYSTTEGGVNMAKTAVTWRDLRMNYAKPFEAAIKKSGLLSVMNSYSEWEGRPICASKKILTDLLRDELGFEGLVVSDYMSVERLVQNFHVADSLKDAAAQCLKAGLDVECPNGSSYNENLLAAVEEGVIDEKYVDISCRRSLALKFRLGLFENPFPKEKEEIIQIFANDECKKKSLQAARKAMTLVKNEGILPLTNKKTKIAVIGPCGNSLRKMWSTYTALAFEEMMAGNAGIMAGISEGDASSIFGQGDNPALTEPLIRSRYPEAKTIFEALNEKYPDAQFVTGCDYQDPQKKDIEAAVEVAKKADVVILTLGGKNGYGPSATNGEGIDSASMGLPGAQNELLEAVGKANPNFIVVHTDAKPLVSSYAYENAKAILEGWLCVTYAGQAIAETITGENNPGGRLQQDVPYSDGVLSYHYQNNASHYHSLQSLGAGAYNDSKEVTARPFGYGIGYTSFQYKDVKIEVNDSEIPVIKITVTVENSGGCAGDEVVQLYGKDMLSTMVRPYKELLGFKRIHLEAGEEKTVEFIFKADIMAFIDEEDKWLCEKGMYQFYVAKDSDDESCCLEYSLEKDIFIEAGKRDFFAEVKVLD